MNEHVVQTRIATPLGEMMVAAKDDALVYAQFVDRHVVTLAADATEDARHPQLTRACNALGRFFAGDAGPMDVPLAPAGTPFQREVWRAILAITPGQVASYADIAAAIGAPRAVRAVGAATGRNPICLFIPCHRVLGSRGALTGYAGGIERKRALLELEARRWPPAVMARADARPRSALRT